MAKFLASEVLVNSRAVLRWRKYEWPLFSSFLTSQCCDERDVRNGGGVGSSRCTSYFQGRASLSARRFAPRARNVNPHTLLRTLTSSGNSWSVVGFLMRSKSGYFLRFSKGSTTAFFFKC